MAQNYYTLQKAAEVLGISEDELNQMVRQREVRAFADGGSWKFRDKDIDDLKQSREIVSDADFFLDESSSGSLDDVVLFDDDAKASPGASDSDITKALSQEPQSKSSGGSDVRLVFGGEEGSGESGIRIVPDLEDASTKSPAQKAPTDSDIRLVDDAPLDATLPTVPTENAPPKLKLADVPLDETLAASAPPRSAGQSSGGFEPIDEDDELPLASDSSILPTASASPTIPAATPTRDEFDFTLAEESGIRLKADGSGEIDLSSLDLADKTPTLKKGAGDDSDSDFSLSLDDDIGLAQDIRPGAGDSGINLASPDDSGILLRSAADSGIKLSSDTDSSDSEFEVSLESDDDIFGSDEVPGFKASDTAPRMAAVQESDSEELSDSDFELAIDEDEIEVEDESGSEVVALDDEDDDSESGEFDEELDDDSPYGSRDSGEPIVIIPQPAPWGVGWVVTLGATTLVFSIVLMMMYEITRNAWSYNQPYTLSGTIINKIHDVGKSLGMP